MKFRFEQRLNEKENKYLEKYSKKVAYKKLLKKYNNYIRRVKSYPSMILFLFIILSLNYISISLRGIKDNAIPLAIGYFALFMMIIIYFLISIILFYFKNKEIVKEKLNEWQIKLVINKDNNLN
ncbi:MAG: hypothetical protein ACOCVF_04180 [bacterium]